MHPDESRGTRRLGIVVVMLMFINVAAGLIGYAVDHLLAGVPGIVTFVGSYGLATVVAFVLRDYLQRFIRTHS